MQSVHGTLVLFGGGGHAVVVAAAAPAAGVGPLGLYDDDPGCAASRAPGAVDHLGPLAACPFPTTPWIVALGDLAARARVLARLANARAAAAPVRHPTAIVSPTAFLGAGVFLAPAAIVHSRAQIGAHAIINTGAIVEHDCRVGENCHLAPRSTLGGDVRIGPNTLVGLGAVILPGVRVGAGCTIGAGAVVLADVPENTRVVGNPARVIP